jgi:hypothetical protein
MTTATVITPTDIRTYLDQVAAAPLGVVSDVLLQAVCDRAESTVNEALGFSFGPYPDTATTRIAYGTGTPWLSLEPHQVGSVTTVVINGASQELGGWTEDTDGNLYLTGAAPFGGYGFFENVSNWARSSRYTVTAKYGYGPAPDSIKQVMLEVAINLFKERDRGMFSDVIGVDGGGAVAVGYKRAFTNRQMYVIDAVRRRYLRGGQQLA